MKIIVEYNDKGGVGKTFTAATLGYLAAANGYPTLIVDTDTQGHIASAYGQDKGSQVFRWMVSGKPLAEVVTPTAYPNLTTLLGNQTTELVDRHFLTAAELEIEATGGKASKFVTAVELAQVRLNEIFDLRVEDKAIEYTFFDCPPRRSLLVEAVIGMADIVLIPLGMSPKEIEGAETAIVAVGKINPSAQIVISPNRFEERDDIETFDMKALKAFKKEWNDGIIYADSIPSSKYVKKVEDAHVPLWEWKGRKSDTLERVKTGYCTLFHLLDDMLKK